MTRATFLAEVVQPNMQEALEEPGSIRKITNAILTIDALAGQIHAQGIAASDPAMTKHRKDDDYRDELAGISRSYRMLRDTAASLKHGTLTGTKARLVRHGESVRSARNTLGLFQCGDHLGGSVVVIEYNPGPGYVRASNVIDDSYRMLKRIVDGEPARTDEHDRGHMTPAP